MGTLLDELLALRVPRAGGVAWEYYFSFGGGKPPWVSALAQGTGIQSIARVAQRTGRKDEVLPIAQPGARRVRDADARGRARRGAATARSTRCTPSSPELRVINGFVQALVGLYDLGKIGGDDRAQALYADGERVARRELPTFDTGAWSLYSRGSVEHESDLSYHQLLRAFLRSHVHAHRGSRLLRHRAALRPVRARAAAGLARHRAAARRHVRQGAGAAVEDLARRAARQRAAARSSRRSAAVVVGHGTPTLGWPVPRKAGAYDVTVTAVDLAGNVGTAEGTIEVLKPRSASAAR